MNDAYLSAVQQNVKETKCEQVCEQMLKMKPQHRKQGNREHALCGMYGTYSVQYM